MTLTVRRSLTLGLIVGLLAVLLPIAPVGAREVAPRTVATTIDDLAERLAPVEGLTTATTARVTDVIAAPHPFVGFGITGSGPEPELAVRTLNLDGEWSGWEPVGLLESVDGPDPDTAEGRAHAPVRGPQRWASDAVWVGPSTHLQLLVDGRPSDDVELMVIDTAGLSESWTERTLRTLRARGTAAPAEATTTTSTAPSIVPRAGWGADESWRTGTPTYRTISHAVIHHTVTMNNYTREQAPQQVRNMYHWHTRGLGWNDLGYNFVVDRFGTIYEGRFGGVDRGVQGAHARGWNSTSFGVAIMGNYNDVDPDPRSMASAARLIAWKYAIHGISPDPAARVPVNGYSIRTLEGHRNVRSTYIEWSSSSSFQFDCPGFNISWRLPDLRQDIQAAYVTHGYGSLVPPPALVEDEIVDPVDDTTDDATDDDATDEPAAPVVFSDVPTTHRFHTQIEWLSAQGISQGYPDGTFRPTRAVTRQALASFLYELAGQPRIFGTNTFTDVGPDHPFHDAITWAERMGVAAGWPDGTFRPNQTVSRQAAMAFLYRDAREPEIVGGSSFLDVPSTHPFSDPITWGVRQGITSGFDDNTFRPTNDVTRQAVAAFLHAYANGD